jgi:hypothetical protein
MASWFDPPPAKSEPAWAAEPEEPSAVTASPLPVRSPWSVPDPAPAVLSTRPRCQALPPEGREACRAPAREGALYCSLHREDDPDLPSRRVDRARWCEATVPNLGRVRCQAFAEPGRPFCGLHRAARGAHWNTPATPVVERAPSPPPVVVIDSSPLPKSSPAVELPASSPPETTVNEPTRQAAKRGKQANGSGAPPSEPITPPGRPARPALPADERRARSTVIAAMGNNPAAILVTIGIVVETGSGPLTWSSLKKAAEREGLLPQVPLPSLTGMLLGAMGPR